MEQNKIVEQFKELIDELAKTKYILADKKIADLLRFINKNKEIYNYIVECSINFNFDRILKQCESSGKFVLPEKNYTLVAFIYELLVRFENKKLNITQFIAKNFGENFENIDGYQYFCLAVLKRFEMVVIKQLTGEKPKKKVAQPGTVDPELVKRVEFLLVSLRACNLKNNKLSEKVVSGMLEGLILLLKKNIFTEILPLVDVLHEIKFKNTLNSQIVKELKEILKVK